MRAFLMSLLVCSFALAGELPQGSVSGSFILKPDAKLPAEDNNYSLKVYLADKGSVTLVSNDSVQLTFSRTQKNSALNLPSAEKSRTCRKTLPR